MKNINIITADDSLRILKIYNKIQHFKKIPIGIHVAILIGNISITLININNIPADFLRTGISIDQSVITLSIGVAFLLGFVFLSIGMIISSSLLLKWKREDDGAWISYLENHCSDQCPWLIEKKLLAAADDILMQAKADQSLKK